MSKNLQITKYADEEGYRVLGPNGGGQCHLPAAFWLSGEVTDTDPASQPWHKGCPAEASHMLEGQAQQ
jgi:hypothetical protein